MIGIPPPPPTFKCNHRWVHLETVQGYDKSGYGVYWRKDIYCCKRCRELKIDELRHNCNISTKYDMPDWYTGLTPS